MKKGEKLDIVVGGVVIGQAVIEDVDTNKSHVTIFVPSQQAIVSYRSSLTSDPVGEGTHEVIGTTDVTEVTAAEVVDGTGE